MKLNVNILYGFVLAMFWYKEVAAVDDNVTLLRVLFERAKETYSYYQIHPDLIAQVDRAIDISWEAERSFFKVDLRELLATLLAQCDNQQQRSKPSAKESKKLANAALIEKVIRLMPPNLDGFKVKLQMARSVLIPIPKPGDCLIKQILETFIAKE